MKRAVPGAGTQRAWTALELEVPSSLADEIAGALAGELLGSEEQVAGPGRSRLRLYPRGGRLVRDPARIEAVLRAFGLDPGDARLGVCSVPDEAWVERYQASLRPIALGRRFVVLPAERFEAPPSRRPLRLIPGRAFGTGEHPTTALAVEALEEAVRPGGLWVDVGTGTGILAWVASCLGAREVIALDVDPEVPPLARRTLDANPHPGPVRLVTGTLDALGPLGADGVVANVSAPFFLGSAGRLRRLQRPGGRLLATGFPVEGEDEVRAALEAEGYGLDGRREREGWVLLEARRMRG